MIMEPGILFRSPRYQLRIAVEQLLPRLRPLFLLPMKSTVLNATDRQQSMLLPIYYRNTIQNIAQIYRLQQANLFYAPVAIPVLPSVSLLGHKIFCLRFFMVHMPTEQVFPAMTVILVQQQNVTEV